LLSAADQTRTHVVISQRIGVSSPVGTLMIPFLEVLTAILTA
jgi:hypothetical protein